MRSNGRRVSRHNFADMRVFVYTSENTDDRRAIRVGTGTSSGSKASFYLTNILEFLPLFRLRQQFEVCGILTDVYVARQRNSKGQVYGFVRFSNVKNIEKLSHALSNVWFGHLRVWAREACFDRFAHNDSKPFVVKRDKRHLEEGHIKKGRKEVGGEGENIVREV